VSDQQTPPDNLEELNRELRVREHDRLDSILETAEESTIKSADGVIRILLLINGGGAVSLLAFVGSLASKDRITTAPQLNAIAESLIPFAHGVACAAICACFFDITNLSYLCGAAARLRQPAFPYVVPTPQSVARYRIGRIFQCLALLAALASLGLLVYGIFDVRCAIRRLGKLENQ
jgi:hypothetical protein